MILTHDVYQIIIKLIKYQPVRIRHYEDATVSLVTSSPHLNTAVIFGLTGVEKYNISSWNNDAAEVKVVV